MDLLSYVMIQEWIKFVVRRICAIFWYNHANNGKGAKFGTNETDIMFIKIQIGGISRL